MKDSKICKKCGELKNVSCFSKAQGMKDGHRSNCRTCGAEYSAVYRKKNPLTEIQKKEQTIRHRNWRMKNPARVRDVHLKRHYNITLEDYNNIFIEQAGQCAVCGIHQSKMNRSFAVDHCHDTGKIRGLLCDKCNTAIGLMNENSDIMQNAIKYLKVWEYKCLGDEQ